MILELNNGIEEKIECKLKKENKKYDSKYERRLCNKSALRCQQYQGDIRRLKVYLHNPLAAA